MGLAGFTAGHLEEALSYLYEYGEETVVLAGGTDLLVRYHGGLDQVRRVLNICELEELQEIKVVGDQIEIGSLVTHTQLEESKIIQKYVPFLAQAAGTVGSPQIRNRGTIGGNLANASPAGDTLPPLIALEARVLLRSQARGEVAMPVSEFLVGPGRNLAKRDELITGVRFAIPEENDRGAFVKLGQRKALAIAVVNGAVLLGLDQAGQKVERCRLVLGAVAPTPVRARKTEQALTGRVLSEEVLAEVMQLLEQEIAPISDIRGSREYRYETARQLIELGIRRIWQGELAVNGAKQMELDRKEEGHEQVEPEGVGQEGADQSRPDSQRPGELDRSSDADSGGGRSD